MKLLNQLSLFLLLLAAAASASAASPAPAGVPRIGISLDREGALYRCGEKAVFRIAVEAPGGGSLLKEGKLSAELTNDGLKRILSREFDLAWENPVVVEGTLPAPGFLRLTARLARTPARRAVVGVYGAGFEPEGIRPAAPRPDDFARFWRDALAKAAALPLDPRSERLEKHSGARHVSYKLSVAAPGGRVYGFLCVPAGDARHPLLVTVPGAGPGAGRPAVRDDVASLVINVHPYDPMVPGRTVRDSYDELNREGFYMYHGCPDREKVFFHRAILGACRLLDWVAARQDIDPRRIGYHGSSQGGAFGLILGSLFGRFQAIVCNVPAMNDHLGFRKDRTPGWPGFCRQQKYSPAIQAMVPYYDAANFAADVHAPIRVIVGFADATCSPSSVYAAYNGIPSKDKRIVDEIGMGHACRPSYTRNIDWVLDVIKKQ